MSSKIGRRSILAAPLLAATTRCFAAEDHDRVQDWTDNFSTDIEGVEDNRQDTWGAQGVATHLVRLQNVPPGKRVRVLRIRGDFLIWPTLKGREPAIVPPGRYMGGLVALHRTPRDDSSKTVLSYGKGWQDHFLYYQEGTNGPVKRFSFDVDFAEFAKYLNPNHELGVKQAVWLNDTGLAAHMETTISNFIYRLEDAA